MALRHARARRCFREVERADYVVEVLSACQHNGFPVVRRGSSASLGSREGGPSEAGSDDEAEEGDAEGDAGGGAGCASREGTLQGMILRSQLLVMLREQASPGRNPPPDWALQPVVQRPVTCSP